MALTNASPLNLATRYPELHPDELDPNDGMTNKASRSGSKIVSESPWFWLCLFTTVGVVMLVSFSPKIGLRQAQLEREFSARQAAGQTVASPADPGKLAIDLQPLLFLLVAIVVCSWVTLWWQVRRSNRTLPPDQENRTGQLDHDVAT
jgi:hypothetical protein